MQLLAPDLAGSIHSTVTVASQEIGLTMERGRWYLFCSSVATWIAQGAADPGVTAVADDASAMIPALTQVKVWGTRGDTLAVLRVGGSDGACSLTPADIV